MNRNGKIREGIRTIVFTLVMTAVCVALVAYAYRVTKPRIVLNETLFQKTAVLSAAGLLKPEMSPEKIVVLYDERVKPEKIAGLDFPIYRIQGGGYVMEITGTGLWGEIVGEVGVTADLATLTGVSFIKNSETPGLGARITEPWFEHQFKGKTAPLNFVPEGTKTDKANQFDAITGATITSTGVRNMLNKAMELAEKLPRTEVKK